MRKIHVYNVDGEPYASAAEVVRAILDEGPFETICHSVTTDIQGALLSAISRSVDGLRCSIARNIQVALVSIAVLVLMYWPVVYNAISLPEATLAARTASATGAVLSLLAVLATSMYARKIRKCSHKINTVPTFRDDNLLPGATAWRQSGRRAGFPWLGLGLMLFSIILNCVVIADYAHPAILSDGAVRYNVGLVTPWTTWETGARYAKGEFVVPFGKMWGDPQYVLRVKYRIRNLDIGTPIPGLEQWEAEMFFVARYLVGQVSDGARTAAPASASPDEIAELVRVELDSPTAGEAFTKWFNGQVLEKYPNLQLEQVVLSIEIMSKSEFGTVYQAQVRRWELQ